MLQATIHNNQELSQLIQQTNTQKEAIALIQEGQQKAVLLSLEMFQSLIGMSDRHRKLSNAGFTEMSQQLFTSAGYDSPDRIMQMLHEVKQEIATAREQRIKDNVNG